MYAQQQPFQIHFVALYRTEAVAPRFNPTIGVNFGLWPEARTPVRRANDVRYSFDSLVERIIPHALPA